MAQLDLFQGGCSIISDASRGPILTFDSGLCLTVGTVGNLPAIDCSSKKAQFNKAKTEFWE